MKRQRPFGLKEIGKSLFCMDFYHGHFCDLSFVNAGCVQ